jgi:alcohol dehydrogenase, propanol-preferring
MKAMVLKGISDLRIEKTPLIPENRHVPEPKSDELLIKISTCGVCHTELDEIEGRTPPPVYPVIPGHQVIGRVAAAGRDAGSFSIGDRVGVAWIFSSCGKCTYCLSGNENLCADFKATGRDANGGYAEYMTVGEHFAHSIPGIFTDEEAAPLLCAGAVGYRSVKLAGLVHTGVSQTKQAGFPLTIGLTGFGAAGHLVLKMIRHLAPSAKICVFARSETEQAFAKDLGAVWAGDAADEPPEKMDTIIDTTPVWKPVVEALKNLKPGGRLVINAIRKENADKEYLLNLDYATHLWMEKEIRSVANVALNDVREFLELAAEMKIKPEYQVYPLNEANKALIELKQQKIRGAKVLKIE